MSILPSLHFFFIKSYQLILFLQPNSQLFLQEGFLLLENVQTILETPIIDLIICHMVDFLDCPIGFSSFESGRFIHKIKLLLKYRILFNELSLNTYELHQQQLSKCEQKQKCLQNQKEVIIILDMICQYGSLEEKKLEVQKQDDGQYYDFQFPPQVFKNKLFRNANQIARQLIRAGIKCFFRRGRLFLREDYKGQKGMNTIFKCKHRQCQARLIYTRRSRQPIMQIYAFRSLHSHKKSKDPEKAKRQQINQFILNLSGKDYQDYRGIRKWMQKFDLSSREALYIVDQLYWANNTEDEILTRLSYEGQCIRRLIDGGQTMLIYLRTNSMKYNYLQYGQTVNVEINYEILRKPTPFGNKYAVIYFYGQDQNLRLILFSVAVMSKQSVNNFTHLFQFFFDTTCEGNLPICIITDQIKTLTIALRNIKKQRSLNFNHLYSWVHLIENMKPVLKQIKNGKSILDLMCRAMQQFHEKTFITIINEIKSMLRGRQDIIKEYLAKLGQCCCRRVPLKFTGYAITTMFGKMVLHRTRTTTVYRIHTGRLFYKLIQIQKILQREVNKVSVMNTGIIKHYPADINFFQNKIQSRLMDLLVRNYAESKDCRKDRINKITFKIIQKNGKQFTCRFSTEFDHWECECRQLYIVGIPCCHLMCVIIDPEVSGSLIYYINSRWIHEKQELISEHAKPFITNKRRRP